MNNELQSFAKPDAWRGIRRIIILPSPFTPYLVFSPSLYFRHSLASLYSITTFCSELLLLLLLALLLLSLLLLLLLLLQPLVSPPEASSLFGFSALQPTHILDSPYTNVCSLNPLASSFSHYSTFYVHHHLLFQLPLNQQHHVFLILTLSAH